MLTALREWRDQFLSWFDALATSRRSRFVIAMLFVAFHLAMFDCAGHRKLDLPFNSAPGEQGRNGSGENRYKGPCPPSGTHHYHFKAFALDTKLSLSGSAKKSDVLKAIGGHVMAKGEIVGLFKK